MSCGEGWACIWSLSNFLLSLHLVTTTKSFDGSFFPGKSPLPGPRTKRGWHPEAGTSSRGKLPEDCLVTSKWFYLLWNFNSIHLVFISSTTSWYPQNIVFVIHTAFSAMATGTVACYNILNFAWKSVRYNFNTRKWFHVLYFMVSYFKKKLVSVPLKVHQCGYVHR